MPAGGIRTHNPSKRAAADPRLRLLGYWDRHTFRVSSSFGATAPSGPGPTHYQGFINTLRHTTLGRTQRSLPDKQHSQETKTSMPPVGFEPIIPESERQ